MHLLTSSGPSLPSDSTARDEGCLGVPGRVGEADPPPVGVRRFNPTDTQSCHSLTRLLTPLPAQPLPRQTLASRRETPSNLARPSLSLSQPFPSHLVHLHHVAFPPNTHTHTTPPGQKALPGLAGNPGTGWCWWTQALPDARLGSAETPAPASAMSPPALPAPSNSFPTAPLPGAGGHTAGRAPLCIASQFAMHFHTICFPFFFLH